MANPNATEGTSTVQSSVQETVRSTPYVARSAPATTVGECADSIDTIEGILRETPAGRAVLEAKTTFAEKMASQKLDEDEMLYYCELCDVRSLKGAMEQQARLDAAAAAGAKAGGLSATKQKVSGMTKASLRGMLPDELELDILGTRVTAKCRFSGDDATADGERGVGYNVNGKVDFTLDDGREVVLQVGANITVIGSKQLPCGDGFGKMLQQQRDAKAAKAAAKS